MKKSLAYIIVLVLLGAVAAAFYFQRHAPVQSETIQRTDAVGDVGLASSSEPAIKPQRTPPPGYMEYYNPDLNISFFYPSNLTMKPYHIGAMTLTFEDINTLQGFQIYIVHYAEPQVSQQEFLRDEPSGVRNEPKDITIDGATASSFYGYDPRLGDTAEIWFVHGGYLYEVTTIKSDAGWLSGIMATWQFLK